MSVLPDGHSIILTAQLHGSVSNQVIKGTFKGDVFEGFQPRTIQFRPLQLDKLLANQISPERSKKQE
jgi:hypothetical protein